MPQLRIRSAGMRGAYWMGGCRSPTTGKDGTVANSSAMESPSSTCATTCQPHRLPASGARIKTFLSSLEPLKKSFMEESFCAKCATL